MASTYSDLKIELIGTGDQTGTWGTTTNNNFSVAFGEAITGSADVAFSSADVTVTLTDTNAAQTARNLRLNLTGTSGGARNLILGSGCQIEKLYLINNGLADAVTVKNTSGTGIAVPAGKSMFVFNNGTNVIEAVTGAVNLSVGNIAVTGGSINGTTVGATTASTGAFTTITGTNDASISGLTVGKGTGSAAGTTVVGNGAVAATNTGDNLTAVGAVALAANTSGTQNSAFGRQALQQNTTGSYNTALGHTASYGNTTGSNNVAVGRDSLFSNTTASNNTAVGYQSLYANTTGASNTAMGYLSLDANTTGTQNVSIGVVALTSNTTGGSNVGIGVSALEVNTTGSNNVGLGLNSGNTITTGTYNTMLGNNAQASAATNNYELVISASTGITGKGSSTGYIYPNAGGVFQGDNSSTWSTTSDQRLKKNIVDNNTGLDKITSIQVRNFEYRLPEEITEVSPDQAIPNTGVQLGVIAQEIQQVLPECVKQESTGIYTVNADPLIWYLINAVKELKAEIDQLKGA